MKQVRPSQANAIPLQFPFTVSLGRIGCTVADSGQNATQLPEVGGKVRTGERLCLPNQQRECFQATCPEQVFNASFW